MRKSAEAAFGLGFIKSKEINGIYDLKPLNKVLKKKKLEEVR